MKFRFIKIFTVLLSFFFLTGFLPLISFLGPSLTAVTSGNIYKAGAQYMVNKTIKDSTGKNSFTYFKEKIEKNNHEENFKEEFIQLVERRIKITREKLDLEKFNQ